jgi:hypothetical protein
VHEDRAKAHFLATMANLQKSSVVTNIGRVAKLVEIG